MDDSKPRIRLSQGERQRLHEALARIGADLSGRLAAASRQAGEAVAKAKVARMMRAFNYSLEQVMRHPLQALRDWWTEDEIEYPPRRFTGGRRDRRG